MTQQSSHSPRGAGRGLRRREFLGGLAAGAIGSSLVREHGEWTPSGSGDLARASAAAIPDPPAGLTRTWLGPAFWSNRLQDFRVANRRYECVGSQVMRTVALLTWSLSAGQGTASIAMRTGTLAAGSGFSGFLVGVGAGALDYRAAALAQAASGTAGGLLCTYEADGHCRFRSHTSETTQLSYPIRPPAAQSGPAPARTTSEDVTLTLGIAPSTTAGRFLLTL